MTGNSKKHNKKDGGRKSNLGEITMVHGHHVYDRVDLSPVKIELDKSHQPVTKVIYDRKIFNFRIRVFPLLSNPDEQAPCFTLLRNYDDFTELDSHLHTCPDNIPDCEGVLLKREFSQLANLQNLPNPNSDDSVSYISIRDEFAVYISRLQQMITDYPRDFMKCNEVLNWFCLDNMGRQITVIQDEINQPGAYTGQCVKEYVAQCQDELSMKPGDPITVLKICKPSESGWWYGKNKFNVGYFPFDCIKLIATEGDKKELLESFAPRLSEVGKKHGKKIVTLKELLEKRPNQEELRRKKILKDPPPPKPLNFYIEELERTPWVVEVCIKFINKYGITSGVYRKPGSIVNVELLRQLFSRGKVRVTADELIAYAEIKNDQYCVASYLKGFFRDLKDPLILTEVFEKCENARNNFSQMNDRKEAYIEALQCLPQDHWNTLKLLMTHLYELSKEDHITNMNAENLARIWTSNLVKRQPGTGFLMPSGDLDAIALMKANVCQDGDIIADLIKMVPQIFGYQKPIPNIEKFLNSKRQFKLKYIGPDGLSRRMTVDSIQTGTSSPSGKGLNRRRSSSLRLRKPTRDRNLNEVDETDEKENKLRNQLADLSLGDEKENLTAAKKSFASDVSETRSTGSFGYDFKTQIQICPISIIKADQTVLATTPTRVDVEPSESPKQHVLKSNSSARNSATSDEIAQGTAKQQRLTVNSQQF
ncbi:rho GTPase-activating protein 32-like isoform X2 [Convolutriloba macropyga]|uniref:rho GTPase-activating protein 32-like isoform X2 n=1 Tax=Convolutriloba macropyga TaxID=536237 RepID=UPI003F51B473